MGITIRQYASVVVTINERESDAVKIAVSNLVRDFKRVLKINTDSADPDSQRVLVGTVGVCDDLEEADLVGLFSSQGRRRKEAYVIRERRGMLVIAGSDRRGTIYGIYEFCRRVLGVSPWYFMADVPVRPKNEISLPDDYHVSDHPSIEYRGIFINDEEELDQWAQKYLGETTIGPRTYEKIFELMLRLKLNYIWPAMHVNAFNANPENSKLADKMGIVVGTSHCDMLMRSNNKEWKPWLEKKGYSDVIYDFTASKESHDAIIEYWQESVEQNKNYEVTYTLGMRGIHDSGFETVALSGLQGEELLRAKIDLLEDVIKTQEDILSTTLDYKPMKIFVPYKEVLELYDNGLHIPEDYTLIWVNDNYGHVRRYPGPDEKKRPGGNGLYYHNSYWAPPGASYLFLCSMPLAQTRNELKKAYEEGIRKLWVTNFGAIKPLEQQLTYYALLSWDIGKEETICADEVQFLAALIDETFSGKHGKKLAPLLVEFDQLTNVRKIEQMDSDAFSQTAYTDEAVTRVHRYEYMFKTGNRIYHSLPDNEKDAFFQLILMKIHAAYYTYAMYYYADRSNLCIDQGKTHSAADYTAKSLAFDHARRSMLYYYNHVMANGKWDGMVTPEDFPPPRTAMYPACKPPLRKSEDHLIITCQNNDDKITFVKPVEKWFEIANAGDNEMVVTVDLPGWLRIAENSIVGFDGHGDIRINGEERILLEVDWEQVPEMLSAMSEKGEIKPDDPIISIKDAIHVMALMTGESQAIPVEIRLFRGITLLGQGNIVFPPHMEDDGMLRIEADMVRDLSGAWIRIPNLGRNRGSIVEARTEGATLTYEVTVTSGGAFLLELHRFPTLNSMGRIRIGVSVDENPPEVIESDSTDEFKGDWKSNVRNNVDKLYLRLPNIKPGAHRIIFHAMDKYFSFSRFVIYTRERQENTLGIRGGDMRLPLSFDAAGFCWDFYGKEAYELPPRPVYYAFRKQKDDGIGEHMEFRPQYGMPIPATELLEQGQHVVSEKDGRILIEAVTALSETKNAFTECGKWDYCNAPSHGESGLAMYIRDPKELDAYKNTSWGGISAVKKAPSLHYVFEARGGTYRIWAKILTWGLDESHFTIGVDDRIYSEQDLYGGQPIWRFSGENIWRWVPLVDIKLRGGRHTLRYYALSSGVRVEQFYVTATDELPPAMV
ncbi:MAG: glycosyl hydrolase 115 family protein [Butyrivibrio sp.]|nr:glycosyl hydrolase 115 family protein [Butyrivibrio sp.]